MRSDVPENQRHSSDNSVMQVQRDSTAGAAMQDATLRQRQSKSSSPLFDLLLPQLS
jgi:hypothetical protein